MLIRFDKASLLTRVWGGRSVSAVAFSVLLSVSVAMASNMLPVFTVEGDFKGSVFVENTASIFVPTGVLSVSYIVNPNNTAATIADNLTKALNDKMASKIPNFFTFTNRGLIGDKFVITSALAPGSTVKSFGDARRTGKGLKGSTVTVSVDPLPGSADFEITGEPNGDGPVTIGINGVTESVSTTPGESDATIMQQLENLLATNDHLSSFSNGIMSATDAEFTMFGIDTGDPFNCDDVGAFVKSDDTGLSTYADVFVIPEPSTLAPVAIGFAAVFAALRRPRTIPQFHNQKPSTMVASGLCD